MDISIPSYKLELMRRNPEMFIPARLIEVLKNKKISAMHVEGVWLGRFNNEYQPDIALLITQKNSEYKIDNHVVLNPFTRALYNLYDHAHMKGLIDPCDEPLISFLAKCIHPDGIEVESFVIAKELRGQGIGQDFYDQIDLLLSELDFKYLCGSNDASNISFYESRGRCFASQVDLIRTCPSLRWRLSWNTSPYFTVRFLDKELERNSLKV